MSEEQKADAIEIGVVSKPHGVRGAFKIWLHNPNTDALESAGSLILRFPDGQIAEDLRVITVAGGQPVLTAAGIDSREAADAIRGAKLMLDREAVALEEDQYLYADLVGCQVFEGDRDFGAVMRVFEAGSSDVLVVQLGDEERLIPLLEPWVVAVDIAGKRVEISEGEQWEAQKV